jgi:hypothetical protein
MSKIKLIFGYKISTFTGLTDIDILTLLNDPFLLIDLYRTNNYMYNLLNSPEALKMLQNKYEVSKINSFP